MIFLYFLALEAEIDAISKQLLAISLGDEDDPKGKLNENEN